MEDNKVKSKSISPQQREAKQLKKARKKLLKNIEKGKATVKPAHQASNPGKRVAKNIVISNNIDAKAVAKLLLSMMAPSDFPPVRLGANSGAYQTALANPHSKGAAGFIDPDLTVNATGSMNMIAVFRDLFRFSVQSFFIPAGVSYYYRTSLDGSVGFTTTPVPLVTGRFGWFSGEKPHGDFLYPGRFNNAGRSYIWANAADVVNIIVLSPTNQFVVTPFYYRADGSILNGQLIICNPSTTTTITPPLSAHERIGCYVGFDVNSTFSTPTTFQVQIEVTNAGNVSRCYGHRSLPWTDPNLASIDAVRVYAASILLSNDAAPLDKEGKIAAVQWPAGTDWRQHLDYDAYSSAANAKTFRAENGYYGFLKPTQAAKDFEFRDQSNVTRSDTVSYAWFDLSTPNDFLSLCTKITKPEGRDFEVTLSAAYEYRTDDQTRDRRVPTMPPRDVEEALYKLGFAEQHHENPFHMGDITDWVSDQMSKIWSGVKWAFPKVLDGLTTAAKVGAAVAPFIL